MDFNHRKPWNSFYSPMHDYVDNTGSSFDNTYDSDGEIAYFQISVGSKNFPEYPIRSLQEAYYQLRKTLGVHDQHNSIDISQKILHFKVTKIRTIWNLEDK